MCVCVCVCVCVSSPSVAGECLMRECVCLCVFVHVCVSIYECMSLEYMYPEIATGVWYTLCLHTYYNVYIPMVWLSS